MNEAGHIHVFMKINICLTHTKRIKQNKNNKADHISYSRKKINICVTNTKCIKQNKNNKTDHIS